MPSVASLVDQSVPSPNNLQPEQTALLAYRYWEERGWPTGTPDEDWFRAEEEIKLRQQERTEGREPDQSPS